MRLISKFHDYYDTAIGYGIDPNCVYERKTEKFRRPSLKLGKVDTPFTRIRKIFKIPRGEGLFQIIFCGKIYTGYTGKDSCITYGNEEVLDAIKKDEDKYHVRFYSSWRFNDLKRILESKLAEDKIMKLHHDTGIPVIYVDENKVIYNPMLSDYSFYKVMDSYSAFQEISMFISGVLGGQSPKIVQLPDKDILTKHGFDKMSFRKEKQIGK